MEKRKLWETLEKEILNLKVSDDERKKLFKRIMELKDQKINLLIAGATGSGKSSTINALFENEVAKVGYGVNPETMDIRKFELENLILWDSPGLGDSIEKDKIHAKNIIDKLVEKDNKGNALIDIVLVILDGSSRDLGTSYELINQVIIPNMSDKSRILVAINQCDVAMKGKNWDRDNKKPETELELFLNEKVESVKKRVKESTGVGIEPIFYSATEYYNMSKLLYFIIQNTPETKRMVYIDNLNNEPQIWKGNDAVIDYNREIKKSLVESVRDGIVSGSELGGEIGAIFGPVGETVGKIIGGVIGAIGGFFGSIFS